MAAGSLDIIASEIKAVQGIIDKSLKIRPGLIKSFAHIDEDYLTQKFYPTVILLVARMFNLTGAKPVSLAAVIQFIYMAAIVHFRISDQDLDPAETDLRDGAQYPVLVGDYLYGRFFTTLCKGQMTEFLPELAEVICQMNTGGILRTADFSNSEQIIAVVEKESAVLLQEGCKVVGQLAQCSPADLDKLNSFGYNIGMAYGLMERGLLPKEAGDYMRQGLEILEQGYQPSTAKEVLVGFLDDIDSGDMQIGTRVYGSGMEGCDISDKEEYVHDIFSKIAGRYDFLNTVLSLNRDKHWRKYTVAKASLKPGGKVLDVCCGTGMISMELAKAVGPMGKVVGLDFCGDMLEVGRENLKKSPYGENIELVEGNAMELPFPDNTFDAATIGFGLRNVPDMRVVIKEMIRVVKPGGRVVSLEFSKPTVPIFKQIYNFYFQNWVPFLGKLGVGIEGPYTYLHKSWTFFPHQKEVKEIFDQAGLIDADYYELTGGVVSVHVGVKPVEGFCRENVAAARESVEH